MDVEDRDHRGSDLGIGAPAVILLPTIMIFHVVCSASLSTAEDPKVIFMSKLEALQPERPEAYLELAEDVLDERTDGAWRALAIELCVIAHHLDTENGGTRAVASGACALLASIPGHEAHSRWLRLMARECGDSVSTRESSEKEPFAIDYAMRYRIAVLIGQVRSGDGAGARANLSKSEIKDSVKSMKDHFRSFGLLADPEEMSREASRWPCPDCDNERITRRAQTGSGSPWRICAHCGGVPGPRLPRSELLSSLRAESALLEGTHRSWAAQLEVDFGAPLVDLVPEIVAQVFRVDTSLTIFRDGRWVKPS